MIVRHRHWVRGILGGLIFGLGLGIGSIVYGITTLGALTPWVAIALGLVIGIVLVFVPAIRKGRTPAPPPWAPPPYAQPPNAPPPNTGTWPPG